MDLKENGRREIWYIKRIFLMSFVIKKVCFKMGEIVVWFFCEGIELIEREMLIM